MGVNTLYNYYIVEKEKKKTAGEDVNLELLLRPNRWEDYVGQESESKPAPHYRQVRKGRGENDRPSLFYGQAGLGKTTLAYLPAKR